jgi:hypothetical protein
MTEAQKIEGVNRMQEAHEEENLAEYGLFCQNLKPPKLPEKMCGGEEIHANRMAEIFVKSATKWDQHMQV